MTEVRVASALLAVFLTIFLLAFFLPTVSGPVESRELAATGEATLVVEVEGVDRARGGTLLLSIYRPDGFLDRSQEVAAAEVQVPVAAGRDRNGAGNDDGVVRLTVTGLPPGEYSFSVLQDENGNRDMDQGFLGIPQEGFAFSNNVRPVFSAPDGKETAVAVGAGVTVARVGMLYW